MADILQTLNNTACEDENKKGICRVFSVYSLSLCCTRQIPYKVTGSLYDPECCITHILQNALHFREFGENHCGIRTS